MPPVRPFAMINQKGGVGKTTTVANLAAAVAARGFTVCCIDLDPQSHLTLHFGVDPDADTPTTYEVMTGQATLRDASVVLAPNLHLVPSTIDLAGAEVEIAHLEDRELVLRNQLHDLDHDFAFVDCPPSLGLLTINALAAVSDVIIPLQPHFLALQGLGRLLETVSLVHERINPDLAVSGVLLCMYETNTRLAGEVLTDLTEFFASARGASLPWSHTHIFRTAIRRNIKLAESPSYGLTIFQYEARSHGAEDYANLAEEFLHHFAPTPAPQAAADQPTDTPPQQQPAAPAEETPAAAPPQDVWPFDFGQPPLPALPPPPPMDLPTPGPDGTDPPPSP